MRPRWMKNSFLSLLILVALAAMFFNILSPSKKVPEISLNAVATQVQKGEIKKIIISGDNLTIVRKDDREFLSRKEPSAGVVETLLGFGVSQEELSQIEIEVVNPSPFGDWLTLLGSLLPLIVFGALLFFMLRQAQSGSNQALSFGR
ncbi:MAG: ATP-dependent metallopeptidase FtsH/Yme1/Tma family protein, partial [Anaerolineae bacterium]